MATYSDDAIQAVRDAIDIVDIAGEMTRLQRKGKRYEGLCPFHKEKTPSFSVDPTQGLYYCFGCGAGGDALGLYQAHSGDDFLGAIEALARRYGIPLERTAGRGPRREERGARDALTAAERYFRHALAASAVPRDYLDRRKIPAELRQRYAVGYAPDSWDGLLKALGGKVPRNALLAAGLIAQSERGRTYDRFRHRLIFPIHSPAGRLVGFGGRTLGDDRAKYVNTAETAEFHKGRLLYGFHQAKRQLRDGGRALLVEGYFDVLGAAASGIDWVVAGMGTSLTADQARLLARYVDEVILGYDGDAAGDKACRRALPILLSAGLAVRRARLPAGQDPDSLRLDEGPEAVAELVAAAPDAVRLEVDRLLPRAGERDPRAVSTAAREISALLRPIRDQIARYAYGQHAAERLGLPLEMLWKRLEKGPRREATGDEETAQPRPVRIRSLEERALAHLLGGSTALPPVERLPPTEVFLDAECRNIYATFLALYEGGGSQHTPAVGEVVSRLQAEPGAVDRIARLLLEESDAIKDDLVATLDRLLRRWWKQRQPELMRQIRQAQQHNDHSRLTQLLEEKKALTRSLHPDLDGGLW